MYVWRNIVASSLILSCNGKTTMNFVFFYIIILNKRFWGKNIFKNVYCLSVKLLCKTLLFLRRIHRCIIYVHKYSRKVPVILVRFS
jgi:hypothetical protein